jgi:peptide/nickel transport system substrate-binding protein
MFIFRMFGGNTMAAKLTILLVILLILAVACGTAEAPDPTTAPAAEPTAVTGTGDTSQPTASPQAATPPTEVEVSPGELRVMVGDFASERFDVAFSLGLAGDLNYGRILHGFLISDNEKREMVPGIASNWNISDDGLTWTFTIREGVKFHDGSELTPEDVAWTFQHLFGPQASEYVVAPTALRISRALDTIELNGREVSLRTTTNLVTEFDTLSESGTGWYHGAIPARDQVYNEDAAAAYDQNPIGAGPMSFVDHVKASSMTFERFEDFYYQPENGFPEDKRVNFQRLTLYLVPEEATRVAALRAGDADIAPISLVAREQVESGGGRVIFGKEGAYVWVPFVWCWADASLPCNKKGFRHALHYAIDKELIRDRLYGGPDVFQVKGWAGVTPSTVGYTPEVDPFPYDPEKARQLLAEAGYPGGEGVGKIILHTWQSTSVPFQTEAAQLAAEFWRRELGLDVEVRVGDSTAIREAWAAGQLNGDIIWRDNETRRDAADSLLSGYVDFESGTLRSKDPELVRGAQEVVQILDEEERAQALAEFYPVVREAGYEIGIGYVNIPWGVGPGVEAWEPYPLAPNISALHTVRLK